MAKEKKDGYKKIPRLKMKDRKKPKGKIKVPVFLTGVRG